MQKVTAVLALLAMALLAACAESQTSQPTADETPVQSDRPVITVYTSPA
ncbi:MAG: hypothetical protein Fur0021_30940 [Candidatus Promineifilaceae bacterium]